MDVTASCHSRDVTVPPPNPTGCGENGDPRGRIPVVPSLTLPRAQPPATSWGSRWSKASRDSQQLCKNIPWICPAAEGRSTPGAPSQELSRNGSTLGRCPGVHRESCSSPAELSRASCRISGWDRSSQRLAVSPWCPSGLGCVTGSCQGWGWGEGGRGTEREGCPSRATPVLVAARRTFGSNPGSSSSLHQ